jgi:hypothetical protein
MNKKNYTNGKGNIRGEGAGLLAQLVLYELRTAVNAKYKS